MYGYESVGLGIGRFVGTYCPVRRHILAGSSAHINRFVGTYLPVHRHVSAGSSARIAGSSSHIGRFVGAYISDCSPTIPSTCNDLSL